METRYYGQTGAQTTAIGLGGAFLTGRSFADGVAKRGWRGSAI